MRRTWSPRPFNDKGAPHGLCSMRALPACGAKTRRPSVIVNIAGAALRHIDHSTYTELATQSMHRMQSAALGL
jgi:hypothetical protein